MYEYGLTQLQPSTGRDIMVIADGDFSGMKSGGISLDAAVIPQNLSGIDLILADDSRVPDRAYYMRYGQIITKETTQTVVTVTIGGTATGGTFTLTFGNQTTAAIAFNATAATVAAAVAALSNIGSGNVVGGGGALPGTPVTLTFAANLGAVALPTATNNLTGTAPTVTPTLTTPGTATAGKFGPYDSAATDGRQTLTRGECFVLNRTWIDRPTAPLMGMGMGSAHPPVFDKGTVWRERLLITTGAASLAAGPTVAAFETAFPGVRYFKN